jgi:hypothetical protein
MKTIVVPNSALNSWPELPENQPVKVEKAVIKFQNGYEIELNESNSEIKGEQMTVYCDSVLAGLSAKK